MILIEVIWTNLEDFLDYETETNFVNLEMQIDFLKLKKKNNFLEHYLFRCILN